MTAKRIGLVMKRGVQILLMALLLLPLASPAREETMEERKRRITRKYLREHTNITQGEAEVPVDAPEDGDVLGPEQFEQAQSVLQQQEPGVPMPRPARPPRPRPSAEDRNWLLSAESPSDDDPYADPFSLADPDKSTEGDWATWGMEREPPSGWSGQRDSGYGRASQGIADEQRQSHEPRREGLFNPRDPHAFSAGEKRQGFLKQDPGTGIFGRQQKDPSGTFDLSRDRTFNPTLQKSRLQSPFPREPAQSVDRSFGSGSRMQPRGYIPYKSPYQTRREQSQWGGQKQPEPEYRKKTPYQEWKNRNPNHFDPSRDDAFIDELMPKTGR